MEKDFVTIATFNTERDAEIARAFLASYNISAHLLDTGMTSATINITGASAYTDVRLCVHPADADRARELIKEYRQRSTNENAPKVIPPPADGIMLCPACGSDAVEKRLPRVILVFVAIPSIILVIVFMVYQEPIIGIPLALLLIGYLFFVQKSYYCLNCYHSWKVSDKA